MNEGVIDVISAVYCFQPVHYGILEVMIFYVLHVIHSMQVK